MGAFDAPHCVAATVIAASLGWRGYRKKSLTLDGAVSAVAVGFLSFAGDIRSGVLLITFYFCGSKATKVKKEMKEKLDDSAGSASVRSANQVLACSAIATALTVGLAAVGKSETEINFNADYTASAITAAILSHYACCNADTLASELGILSTQQPRFILDFREVPKGTNGGVSLLGLGASAGGGTIIGLAQAMTEICLIGVKSSVVVKHLVFGTAMGLIGSVLDSVLGALLQPTYFDRKSLRITTADKGEKISGIDLLTNAQVNLVSVLVSSAIGAFLVGPVIY